MKFWQSLGAVWLVVTTCAASLADVRIELAAQTSDPLELTVGQPVAFSTVLTGLPPGTSLTSLSATVAFDGSTLGTPILTRGVIVPGTLADPFDFVSIADVGLVDATFLTFGSLPEHRIGGDGVFYTFQLTPLRSGQTTLWLDFVDAAEFDSAFPDMPQPIDVIAGDPLVVTIRAVPEPSSLVLAIGGCVAWLGWRVRRLTRRN
jgi:hypothetical protein